MKEYLIWKRRALAMTILVCVLGGLFFLTIGLLVFQDWGAASSLLWIRNVPHTISWRSGAESQNEGQAVRIETQAGSSGAAFLSCYASLEDALEDTERIAGVSGFEHFAAGEKTRLAVLQTDREAVVLFLISPAKNHGGQSLLCSVKCHVAGGRYSQPVSLFIRGCGPQLSMYRYLWEDVSAEYLCREYLTGSYVRGTDADLYYGLLPLKLFPELPSDPDARGNLSLSIADERNDARESALLTIDGTPYYFWTLHSPAISAMLSSILEKEYTYGEVITALDIKCSFP